MATVMMSIVLTCTYVGQIPFGDKILPIQRTCINKPSLYCFFIDMAHPWDFEESVLERKCTLGLSRGIPELNPGEVTMTEIHGQDKRSGAGSRRSEVRQIPRVSRTSSLAEESKRRAVEEATRGSQESKPAERTGEESRRRALDELEAQNASTSMSKIGRHIF